MTPVTWARTSTRRDAAASPTNSKRAATVSGAMVSTETSGGGGAALAARLHAQPPSSRRTPPTAQTAVPRERLARTTASGAMNRPELVFHRQPAEAFAGRREDRVGHRRGRDRRARLADPARRLEVAHE